MTNALIYYRTFATPSTPWANASDTRNSAYATPILLQAAFPNQVLAFTSPSDVLEGVTEQFQKNIKKIPKALPNSARVDKQFNGMLSSTIQLKGNFATPTSDSDVAKLKAMLTQYDLDGWHIFGNIGFYSPNAVNFSFDPSAGQGFTVADFTIGRVGVRNQIFDFTIDLDFGGFYGIPWISGNNYVAGYYVRYNGSLYLAKNSLTNDTTPPSSDPSNWTLL